MSSIPIVYDCGICDRVSSFTIKATHVLPDDAPPTEYTFAVCDACGNPSIFYREDMGDGFENDFYSRYYSANKRFMPYIMPGLVRESYEEAVRCEKAKLYTAASVMIGRALEAVCREYEPKKTMNAAIKAMTANGVLSSEISEWADQLRVLRNYGAHPSGEKISDKDAEEGLDFLQAILDILYNLRPKFEGMRNRRKKPGGN